MSGHIKNLGGVNTNQFFKSSRSESLYHNIKKKYIFVFIFHEKEGNLQRLNPIKISILYNIHYTLIPSLLSYVAILCPNIILLKITYFIMLNLFYIIGTYRYNILFIIRVNFCSICENLILKMLYQFF